MGRRLTPGQQLRQVPLAESLQVSRSPIREALRTLETEGFVRYLPNQGYFVAELDASDLKQLYLARRLLESELLRTIRRPSDEDLAALRAHNAAVEAGARVGSISQMLVSNRAFHFTLLAMSSLQLLFREVERLWQLSEPFRAGYLWLPETRMRIVAEHDAMIDALTTYDIDRLVQTADDHRGASEHTVLGLLVPPDDVPG